MSEQVNKPLWQGICLVAGGAIGAGMFALPMVSAGGWIVWSVIGLLITGAMTYWSCALLAQVNIALMSRGKNYAHKISFSSIVAELLGPLWARVNNISITFILMILMYAYSTAGAGITQSILQLSEITAAEASDSWLRAGFVFAVALVVWLGTTWVSRLSLILVMTMVILFGAATFGLISGIDYSGNWLPAASYWYLPGAVPVYVTAFACAGLVPTLVQHFSADHEKVYSSLLWGTLLTLLVYVFWLWVVFGTVIREEFVQIAAAGGNISHLVSAMASGTLQQDILTRLIVFSHIAIATSFLGISLSLVHFVRDKLALSPSVKHNLIATLVSFAPPAVASFFFPYGFLNAIGLAGLFVAVSFFIMPAMLFEAAKKQRLCSGGKIPSLAVIAFGFSVMGLKLGLLLGWLPLY